LVPPDTAAATASAEMRSSSVEVDAEQDDSPDGDSRELEVHTASSSRHEPPDEAELTPAQVFYLENRERLVSRAQEYYLEKQRELKAQKEGADDVEDEWRYYHDPVVRPPKGHLWATGQEEDAGDGEQHGQEDGWLQVVSGWPMGQLPTPEML
ncbi:unnamed protein product, partial [Polarella glacialis]